MTPYLAGSAAVNGPHLAPVIVDVNKCVVCGAPISVKWEEMGPLRRAVKTCPVDWRHNEANAAATTAAELPE